MSNMSCLAQVDSFFKQYPISQYQKRDIILHSYDFSLHVFYIKKGYVRVYKISEQGEELTLTILKPKDFFPLNYGIRLFPVQYYLEAITPLELWKAPQDKFLSFLKANPEVFYELTTQLLIRFDGVLSRMECLVFSTARIKVAAMIMACAKRFGLEQGHDYIIQVPLTHHDIASMVGITRETTSLEMKKLEKQGFLSRQGRLFVVRNYRRFEREIFSVSQDKYLLNHSV